MILFSCQIINIFHTFFNRKFCNIFHIHTYVSFCEIHNFKLIVNTLNITKKALFYII